MAFAETFSRARAPASATARAAPLMQTPTPGAVILSALTMSALTMIGLPALMGWMITDRKPAVT